MAGLKRCVMVITAGLEYPEFLRWATDHMPPGLTVVKTPQDMEWLVRNPGMLFPQTAAIAAKWFRIVQNDGQERFYQRHGTDLLLTGRRRKDGNMVGPRGQNIYTNGRGVTRYSPMADWSHEEVVGFNFYRDHPCPPTYTWPNGFRVGTGPWAARQYTGSIENGWREVYAIDPQIVRDAAMRFPSAERELAAIEAAEPVPR